MCEEDAETAALKLAGGEPLQRREMEYTGTGWLRTFDKGQRTTAQLVLG